MKKIVRLTEYELINLIEKTLIESLKMDGNENLLSEILIEPEYKEEKPNYNKTLGNKVNNLAKSLFYARNNSWGQSTFKTFFNDFQDMIYLGIALLNWKSNNPNYNPVLLKCAISGIFRESKGSLPQLLRPKELLGAIHNLFGGEHSQGYAQIQPNVAKQYGIDPMSLYSLRGSLEALYKMFLTNYNTAKKYYSGNFVTIYKNGTLVKIPALNRDAALHMAVATHNAGLGILGDWCETNLKNIANKCNITKRKPYPNDKPNLFAYTKKNKKIPNYFPNKGGVHNYMPQFIKCFNSLYKVPAILSTL